MNIFFIGAAILAGIGIFQEVGKRKANNGSPTPQPKEPAKPVHVADMPVPKKDDATS